MGTNYEQLVSKLMEANGDPSECDGCFLYISSGIQHITTHLIIVEYLMLESGQIFTETKINPIFLSFKTNHKNKN